MSGQFVIEMFGCTQTLLSEIADRRMKRKDVAMTYGLALQSSDETDWKKVNAAIIARWSVSGLQWIRIRPASRIRSRCRQRLLLQVQIRTR